MKWDDDGVREDTGQSQQDSHLNFDFLSLLSKPKDYYRILEVDYDATEDEIRSNHVGDYYRILEVDYDATEDEIRSNYIRLALKWHPDKKKDEDNTTLKFQEINEAYQVLSDPVKRHEYDKNATLYAYDYDIIDYLNRYKGLILTCSGLGMKHSIW